MVAKKPSRRVKKVTRSSQEPKVKKQNLKDEVETMEVEEVEQIEQGVSDKPKENKIDGDADKGNPDDELDQVVETKDPLHQVKRKKRRLRSKKKPKKKMISILKNEIATKKKKENKADKSRSKGRQSGKKKKESKETAEGKEVNLLDKSSTKTNKSEDASKSSEKRTPIYHWSITIGGIPKTWKGEIDNILLDYKKFNVQDNICTRSVFEGKVHQVLQLFFNCEEDMKMAIFTGNRKFLEETLSVRTTPARTVYISGIPLDINEEKAHSELMAALGKSVYEIRFPKTKDGKMLGYAIAYYFDESDEEEFLNNWTLQLWDKAQHVYSKEDFFNKYVLYILLKSKKKAQNILPKLEKVFKKAGLEVQVDVRAKKAFFLDEKSVEKALQKSGIPIHGEMVVLSRSPAVQVIVRNIKKNAPECEVMKLFDEIKTLDAQYSKFRSKVTLSVPVEEIEKCKALHGQIFNGRDLHVYHVGSEQYKLYKEIMRKKFKELVDNKHAPLKPGSKVLKKVKICRRLKNEKRWNRAPEITKKVKPLKKKQMGKLKIPLKTKTFQGKKKTRRLVKQGQKQRKGNAIIQNKSTGQESTV